MFPPRFILVLSAQSNVLRASLVTRELKSVASARQTFQVKPLENGTLEFDPAQVWYLMKKVIAACFDIGRTLSRELAGVAIVGETGTRVVWRRENDEVVSHGWLGRVDSDEAHATQLPQSKKAFTESGTLAAWLLWNIAGGITDGEAQAFGSTHACAPFDAEVPIVTVLDVDMIDSASVSGQGTDNTDWILKAAELAWQKLET